MFEIYQTEEKKITKDNFYETVQSASSRCLHREIEEHLEDSGGSSLDYTVCEKLITKDGFLKKTWIKESENIEGLDASVGDDVFLQIEHSIKLLIDTIGENGHLDMSDFMYLISSVGEEMSQEEMEEFFEKGLKQPTKGKFDVRKLLKSYVEMGKSINIFDEADVERVTAQCAGIAAPPKK